MSDSFELLQIPGKNERQLFVWKLMNGDAASYACSNVGSIVMRDNRVICFFKNNLEIGKLIDEIMRGLHQKKIEKGSVCVYPINYYKIDYVDPLHCDGLITVDI